MCDFPKDGTDVLINLGIRAGMEIYDYSLTLIFLMCIGFLCYWEVKRRQKRC